MAKTKKDIQKELEAAIAVCREAGLIVVDGKEMTTEEARLVVSEVARGKGTKTMADAAEKILKRKGEDNIYTKYLIEFVLTDERQEQKNDIPKLKV